MSADAILRGTTALRAVEDYVRLPGYQSPSEVPASPETRTFGDEGAFWGEVLGYAAGAVPLKSGERIKLQNFLLSPWVPRAPGLFWKAESRRLRAEARNEQLPAGSLGIYTPVGKTMQVLGGVGNVRLLPTDTGRLICATSSGQAWQGVPVLFKGDAWATYGDVPTGLRVDLQGTWTPLPREQAQFLSGDAGIPRYCLVVGDADGVTPLQEDWPGSASAWTLFEYRDQDDRIRYDFTYCTFDVNRTGALNEPPEDEAHDSEEAAYFLRDYLQQYHGQALTDFDEELPRFDALLPVSELMSRQVDLNRLRTLVQQVKERALSPETVRYDVLPGLLVEHFSIEELRLLSVDYLGLDLERLVGPAAGLVDHVDALLAYCTQKDRTAELAAGVVQARPQLKDELSAEE